MDNSQLQLIGIWALRCILAIGAIVLYAAGKEDGAGGCIVGIVLSFIFL